MSDPDEPSVLGDAALSATVPDDVWARALSAAFDPDAPAADQGVVPVMDDAGDLPDTTADDGSAVQQVVHDAAATDHDSSGHDSSGHDVSGHDTIDLGEHDHGPAHDHDHHDIDHGDTGDDGHDHDSGWHV